MREITRMTNAEHLHEVSHDGVWFARIYIDFANNSFNVIRGHLDFDDRTAVRNFIAHRNRQLRLQEDQA